MLVDLRSLARLYDFSVDELHANSYGGNYRVTEVSDDYRIRLAIENIPISAVNFTVSDAWNRLCTVVWGS